ncbi:MAG: hypothetical protein EOM24_04290 [Chloroflexia bacterium]|nr:hypothetical protein [Chloroflexia bacterium]
MLGYVRRHKGSRLIIIANVSELPQQLDANRLRLHGSGYRFRDLVSTSEIEASGTLSVEAYQFFWLERM